MATSDEPRLVLIAFVPGIHIDHISVFESRVFAIVVGPSEKVFYAHADMLAKSVVLKRLVEGQFKESNEQRIIWPHWDANTVKNFLEWLYTGDYKCPYPMIIPCPVLAEKTSWEDVSDASSASAKEEQKESQKRDDQSIAQPIPTEGSRNSFTRDLKWIGCRYPTKVSYEKQYTDWIGHVHYATNELDYDKTFMTHAELYAMGCQYLLDDLRALTWQRMKNALVAVGTPYAGSTLVTNITNVIHYVFEQTEDLPDGKEQMRQLLTAFATDHFERIQVSPAFEEFMRSPSESDCEFLADLMANIRVRLIEGNEQLRVAKERAAEAMRKVNLVQPSIPNFGNRHGLFNPTPSVFGSTPDASPSR
ncbi:MAG: hypothetical protein Q9228_001699 [Teloschistes exilis]